MSYIDPISAIDVLIKRKAIQHTKNIQMSPAVPPFSRPMNDTLNAVSQDAMRIMEKPKMETNLKFLCHLSVKL